MKLIYVADDDTNIRHIITSFLKNEGFKVESFPDGEQLLTAYHHQIPDLVILDIMMPGRDGLQICDELRKLGTVPIIIVSARDSELDRITGITLGSDDYLVKPFSPLELVARVKALFRRLDYQQVNNDWVSYGDIKMQEDTRSCVICDKKIELSPMEFAFLYYLIKNQSRAVSREELLKQVWKFDYEVDTRASDDLVKRLRKKLSHSQVVIEAVWGYGFKLGVE